MLVCAHTFDLCRTFDLFMTQRTARGFQKLRSLFKFCSLTKRQSPLKCDNIYKTRHVSYSLNNRQIYYIYTPELTNIRVSTTCQTMGNLLYTIK